MSNKSRFEYALNPLQSWLDHERRRKRWRRIIRNVGTVAATIALLIVALFVLGWASNL